MVVSRRSSRADPAPHLLLRLAAAAGDRGLDGVELQSRIHASSRIPAKAASAEPTRQTRCGYPYAQESVAARQSKSMAATTVLIVDDHPDFRAWGRRMLEREGYRVVGEAADRPSAVACAWGLRPELALVEVYLPDTDGFQMAGWLAELDGAPAVVLISSRDGAGFERLVLGSDARGLVPQDELRGGAIEELL
jgi:CheY-like chemotaxis protein